MVEDMQLLDISKENMLDESQSTLAMIMIKEYILKHLAASD